jgi:hypothetical protein
MGKHLQGIESRIYYNLSVRHPLTDGVGEPKEKRIARGKDDKRLSLPLQKEGGMGVLIENGIEGGSDVYPLGIGRQQWRHDLVMALTSRENFSLAYHFLHFWGEEWARMVCNSNDDKLHKPSGI